MSRSASETVAAYWDENTDEAFGGPTYWLANPIVHARFQRLATDGRFPHWINFCHDLYSVEQTADSKILSVGCGDGGLERHLTLLDKSSRIKGIDLSPHRIEIARQAAKDAGIDGQLSYEVLNAESLDLEPRSHDAIFFDSSLHHLENLETVLATCAEALKDTGYLFLNEYVGPNRFDFSKEERIALEHTFSLIPAKYRRSLAEHDRGKVRAAVALPDPKEVARVDPSESIRSQDILPALEADFVIKESNFPGGTLLQFLLDGIAGNFRDEDKSSLILLDMLFAIEEALVGSGALSPHFILIAAQPKRV